MTDRSADVVTVSVSVAESFAAFGSLIGNVVIVAVLTSDTSTELAGTASVSWYSTKVPGSSGAEVVQVNTPAARTQSGSDSDGVVPAGMGSPTTTPAGSVDGPRFVTLMVYVVDVPAITEATPSDFVIERSADLITASVSVALLFDASGSVGTGENVIETVFTTVTINEAGGTARVSWYVREPPGAIGADVVHVNVPAAIEQSASDSEPFVPAGIGSESTTPAGTVDGPLLVRVIV